MKFESKVIRGSGLGRQIGFPTLNLEIPADFALKDGVYVCKILILGEQYGGVMHFGEKSIGNVSGKSLEVHVLDFSDEICGGVVVVEVEDKLRDVQRFDDVEDLVDQIKEDIVQARKILQK